ncbi:pathogenesis-related protein PRB1-3 [Biomphalaria pfeifferi]|uniref:Pathogenesis-related protein PRB1-3 n=1 Tax=Biomphalaria pfeifferi TaxID=112525 RepID=A0AAD8F8N3_BIOPF|nr:pathogenesis-related protein PRB1-3 [Biomphalaria pfeifferi]
MKIMVMLPRQLPVTVLVMLVQVWDRSLAQSFDPTMPTNLTVDTGISEDIKLLLLRLHNAYRRDERLAGDMNRLDWSPALSQEAGRWVKGCDFKHQNNPQWGENLYRSNFKTTPESTVDNALIAWHLEQYNIMPSPTGFIDCCSENKTTCCHYTQMVWASTEFLGCAINECALLKGDTTEEDLPDAIFLACYYYPPGNVLSQQPFQRTSSGQCSLCSATNPDCDNGLCYFETSRC